MRIPAAAARPVVRPFLRIPPEIEMTDAANEPTQGAMPSRAERLARALNLIALDLCNPWDESTDCFHSFHAPLADDVPLDAQGLRTPLGIGKAFHLDVCDADLAQAADNAADDAAAGLRLLDAVMRAALTDVKLVFARRDNVVRVRTWLLGRLPGQGLVGLRTETTET
jgi:hypothetical protein